MVTRTFNMVERRCKIYNKATASVEEETYISKDSDKKWMSHILKPDHVLLEIMEEKPVTYKLGMSDDDFFRLAEVMK